MMLSYICNFLIYKIRSQSPTAVSHISVPNSKVEIIIRPTCDDIESINVNLMQSDLQKVATSNDIFIPVNWLWDLFYGYDYSSIEFESLLNAIRTSYVLENSLYSCITTKLGVLSLRSLICIHESTKVSLY
jgi:hypothetical protein